MSELSNCLSGLRKRLGQPNSNSTSSLKKLAEKDISDSKRTISPSPASGTNKMKRSSSVSVTDISPNKKTKSSTIEFEEKMKAKALELQNDLSLLHISTNLHLAVEIVKESTIPITLDQLREKLKTTDISKLLLALKNTDRIKYDPSRKTLEYVSLHNIKTTSALLDYVNNQNSFRGISVKELKDGWQNCNPVINDLEKKNKILVLRVKKDNTPKHVWANYRELPLGAIDEEFVTMWNRVKLPSLSELPMKLNERGIKPTSVDPSTLKKVNAAKMQRKQKKPRKGKITNAHMKGVLRDYS